MIKRKTKAKLEKNLQEQEEPEETLDTESTQESKTNPPNIINQLSHPGEFHYQILVKLQDIVEKLNQIVEESKRRNEILEEDIEEDEEDDEN